MTTVLFKTATLLAEAGETVRREVDVLVRGSRIAEIGTGLSLADGENGRTIDASGKLLMPGLINAHFHSPGTLNRGNVPSLPLELFMLREVPPLQAKALSARYMNVSAKLGAAEMLQTGVTSVQDDAFFVPTPSLDTIAGVMNAYREIGIRARVALDQGNVIEYEKYPFLSAILPEDIKRSFADIPIQSDDELIGLYEDFIGEWNGAEAGRLMCAVSCSAPQRVTPAYLRRLSQLAARDVLPYFIHVLETKLQRVLGEERFGKSLVQYLADAGVLSELCNLIHVIWVDGDDLDVIAASGATAIHNPLCNLRLGSGIMPFRAARERGIPIALGSDEAISDDSVNMWSVAKTAGIVHNITSPDPALWPDADEILSCLMGGGARAMLMDGRIGRIACGYEADVIMLDLQTPSFTPLNNPARQLVYCENGSSVLLTMVAGQIVFEGGRLTTIDEAALRAEAADIMDEFRDELTAGEEQARLIEPYYAQMYRMAAARDVGMTRWAGYDIRQIMPQSKQTEGRERLSAEAEPNLKTEGAYK